METGNGGTNGLLCTASFLSRSVPLSFHCGQPCKRIAPLRAAKWFPPFAFTRTTAFLGAGIDAEAARTICFVISSGVRLAQVVLSAALFTGLEYRET
jgi:hypothetical protein